MHAYQSLRGLKNKAAGHGELQDVSGKFRQVRFPVYVAIEHMTES